MKILNKFRSISRKGKLAIAVVALGLGFAAPLVQAEFYPARPTYDYNKFDPNNLNCNDPNNPAAQNGRCGSMTGPVFNSFVNTPSYGDEREFFDGRRSDMPTNTNHDNINNVNEGSKEVVLRMYVHNNANQDTNGTVGVARDAKVRIALPTATEQVLRARAYISASNAAMVEDTADLLGTEKFNVSYIPGSAKLLRGTAQYPLSDTIVGDGAPIGHNAMDGNLPGCFEYAALVEIRVKVNVQENPELQLTKQVKIKGGEGWSKEISTKPGTEIQWRLGTKNISNSNLDDVIVRDVLPPHLRLVPGSVRLINIESDRVQTDGPLFQGGFNVGNYIPGSTQYVIFNTIVLDDFNTCEVRLRNLAYAKSDQTPNEVTDSAVVNVTKENCQPTNPTYKCDMLTATPGANRKVKFDTTASATGGAQIVLYEYDFGDNTQKLVTDKASVEHTYANDGRYVARVRVQVRVNGEIKYAESDKCAAAVTFTTPGQPGVPVTPAGSVTTLPNTGIGSVLGIFAAVSAVVAIAYHRFLSRQLNS